MLQCLIFSLSRSQLISAAVESFGRITTAKTDNPYCTLDKQKWSGTNKTSNPYNTLKLKEEGSNVDAVVCGVCQFCLIYQLPFQGSRCVPQYLQAPGALAEDCWSGQSAHHGHHHDAAVLSHQLGYVTTRLPRSLPPTPFCGSGEIHI